MIECYECGATYLKGEYHNCIDYLSDELSDKNVEISRLCIETRKNRQEIIDLKIEIEHLKKENKNLKFINSKYKLLVDNGVKKQNKEEC